MLRVTELDISCNNAMMVIAALQSATCRDW